MEKGAGDRTVVIGLGNPILGDDGVGICVLRLLRDGADLTARVDFEEACVGGLRLVELMGGYDRAIIIDAYQGPLLSAGEIAFWSLDDLRGMGPVQPASSPHDASLPTAYDAVEAMGLPLPANVFVVAVGATQVESFSTELTPSVSAAVPRVVQMVREALSTADACKPS